MPLLPTPAAASFAALLVASLASAPAQCATNFVTGTGLANALYVSHLVARDDGVVAVVCMVGTVSTFAWEVRKWDGSTWSTLGGPTNAVITALVELPGGDLVVGGHFTSVGNVTAFGIARWDGTAWHSFGTGTNGFVEALTVLPGGDLVVAGHFTSIDGTPVHSIASFDGTTWTALGNAARYPGIRAVAALPDGRVAAAGNFLTGQSPYDQVALWDGANWSLLTLVNSGAEALTTLAGGELAILSSSGNFMVWNGSTFAYGPNTVGWTNAFASLPNGDLVTCGRYAIGSYANRVLRWNGTDLSHTSWTPIAHVDHEILALAMTPRGQLALGGAFQSPQPRFALLATTCPAAAVASGNGCTGSGGLNTLSAVGLPWTGTTFAAQATGLSQQALALSLFGFAATSLPQPLGLPGCRLLASPDAVQLLLPSNGSVTTHLPIPNSAAFAGLLLHHQVLAAELDPLGAVTAATGTNALQLTLGTF